MPWLVNVLFTFDFNLAELALKKIIFPSITEGTLHSYTLSTGVKYLLTKYRATQHFTAIETLILKRSNGRFLIRRITRSDNFV